MNVNIWYLILNSFNLMKPYLAHFIMIVILFSVILLLAIFGYELLDDFALLY